MSNPNKPNDRLEQALGAMRSDLPTPEAGSAAQDRVWQNLSAQSGIGSDHQSDTAIQGCESVRALLGAYPGWLKVVRVWRGGRALLQVQHAS